MKKLVVVALVLLAGCGDESDPPQPSAKVAFDQLADSLRALSAASAGGRCETIGEVNTAADDVEERLDAVQSNENVDPADLREAQATVAPLLRRAERLRQRCALY